MTELDNIIKLLEECIKSDDNNVVCETGQCVIEIDLLIDIKSVIDRLQTFVKSIQLY